MSIASFSTSSSNQNYNSTISIPSDLGDICENNEDNSNNNSNQVQNGDHNNQQSQQQQQSEQLQNGVIYRNKPIENRNANTNNPSNSPTVVYRTNSVVFFDDGDELEEEDEAFNLDNINLNRQKEDFQRTTTTTPRHIRTKGLTPLLLPSHSPLSGSPTSPISPLRPSPHSGQFPSFSMNNSLPQSVLDRRQKCLERSEFAKSKKEQMSLRRHNSQLSTSPLHPPPSPSARSILKDDTLTSVEEVEEPTQSEETPSRSFKKPVPVPRFQSAPTMDTVGSPLQHLSPKLNRYSYPLPPNYSSTIHVNDFTSNEFNRPPPIITSSLSTTIPTSDEISPSSGSSSSPPLQETNFAEIKASNKFRKRATSMNLTPTLDGIDETEEEQKASDFRRRSLSEGNIDFIRVPSWPPRQIRKFSNPFEKSPQSPPHHHHHHHHDTQEHQDNQQQQNPSKIKRFFNSIKRKSRKKKDPTKNDE